MLKIPQLDHRLIDDGKVVSLTHPPHFTSSETLIISGTHLIPTGKHRKKEHLNEIWLRMRALPSCHSNRLNRMQYPKIKNNNIVFANNFSVLLFLMGASVARSV
jgi:hypothetical protein